MGLHRGFQRPLATLNGNVMTSGGSINLAKGQLGIFDIRQKSINGLTAISDFSSAGAKDQFQIKVGNNTFANARTSSNKNKETRPFKLSEVKDLQVFSPNANKKVDKFLVGYDGINASSALTFEQGVEEIMSIKLEGGIIDLLGYQNGCTMLNVHFEKESADQTNQEIVEKAVKRLKDDLLKEQIPVTDAIKVSVINSENPASIGEGIAHTFYNLSVVDAGESNALAEVQAQFGTSVVRSSRTDLTSVYTVLLPTADGAPADFDPETGADISWIAGETCNAISEVYTIQLADTETQGDRLEELQAAFPELTITIAQGGVATQTLVTLTGTDGTANINVAGVDYLTTFTTNLTTSAANFVTTHATALAEVGVVVTSNAAVLTFVEEDENPVAITVTNATDSLDGTVADSTEIVGNLGGGCQTVYQTTVTSNVVCEDCDPILRDSFETEAPQEFDFISWQTVEPVYSATALMGIKIEGKETINVPSELLRDGVPFLNNSVRVSVAGGFRSSVYNSFTEGSGDRFKVKVLQRAEDLENLGGNLWELEDMGFTYFNGYPRHRSADGHQNEWIKAVMGEESVLKGNTQYIVYALSVQPKSHSQGFAGLLEESFQYMILVEVGKQAGIEALLNDLATNAGIDTVSA